MPFIGGGGGSDQADLTQSVAIAANGGTAVITPPESGVVAFTLTSLGVGGTVVFEGTVDGQNWLAMYGQVLPLGGTSPLVQSTSAAGSWLVNCNGLAGFRLRATALTSGTITGTLRASARLAALDFYNDAGSDGPRLRVAHVSFNGNVPDAFNSGNQEPNSTGMLVIGYQYMFNGSTWDKVRTASTFKTAKATASGDTAVWTPAAGKRFVLLGYEIMVTANAAQAVAGVLDVVLRDAAAPIGQGLSVFVPGAAGAAFAANASTGWVSLLGLGYQSAAINQALNVNLSAALTAGTVRVNAVGTEE